MDAVPAARPRVSRWGTYYPKRYSDFKKALKEDLKERWGQPIIDRPVVVQIHCWVQPPGKTKLAFPKPDVDNYAKAVLDAMIGTVLEDDWLVKRLIVEKSWGSRSDPGRILVVIEDYEGD